MDNIPINTYTIQCTQQAFDEMLQVMIDMVYKQSTCIPTDRFKSALLFDALTALEKHGIEYDPASVTQID